MLGIERAIIFPTVILILFVDLLESDKHLHFLRNFDKTFNTFLGVPIT
jgi:hypothetical protein